MSENLKLEKAVAQWGTVVMLKGSNDKLDYLREIENAGIFQHAMHLAYNPFITFGIKKIDEYERDHDCIEFDYWEGFVSVLGKLSRRELTGQAGMNALTFILSQVPVHIAAFLETIVAKDMRMGLQAKSINKAIPKLIPTFDVALAQKVENLDSLKYPVMIQPKLDGIRCIAITDLDGKATLYSRRGKVFENFPKIEHSLSKYKDMVFDGEIMDGEFQNLMTQVHRKDDVDTSNAVFNIFDFMTKREWDNQESEMSYARRHEILSHNFKDPDHCCRLVEIHKAYSPEEVMRRHDKFLEQGYEGTMIKDPLATYKFKRSKALLKYKPVNTIDLQVVAMVEGTGKHQGSLGALVCRYFDDTVNVGSGFDDAERAAIWSRAEEFAGTIIEVQYQDATTNKDGQKSLRFPVYLGIR